MNPEKVPKPPLSYRKTVGTQTELVITIAEKTPEHKKGKESIDKGGEKVKKHEKHGHRSRKHRRIKPAHPEPTETKKRPGPDNRTAKHRKREV